MFCDWIRCKPGSELNANGHCVDHYKCPTGQVFIAGDKSCQSISSCVEIGKIAYKGLCLTSESVSIAACGKEGMKYFSDTNKCYPEQNILAKFSDNDPILNCGPTAEKDTKELIALYEEEYTGSYSIGMIKDKIKKCNLDFQKLSDTSNGQIKSKTLNDLEKLGKENVKQRLELNEKTGDFKSENEIDELEKLGDINARAEWKNKIPAMRDEQKQNCVPVDMRDKMGAIRDQDGTGLCYAYAAANLVTYKLGKRVSALDISYNMQHDSKGEYKYESGGDTLEAVKRTINNGGFCLEEKFSDSDAGDTHSLYSRIKDLSDKKWTRDLNLSKKDFNQDSVVCAESSSLTALFPQQRRGDLLATLNFVVKDQAGQLIEKACAPRIKPGRPMELESIWMDGKYKLSQFDEIDKILSNKNPLEISVKKFRPWLTATEQNGMHGMTLAGRRWNDKKQQCEYIIRNSWGASCDGGYPKEFSCEKGDLFVTKKDLSKYIFEATYIK